MHPCSVLRPKQGPCLHAVKKKQPIVIPKKQLPIKKLPLFQKKQQQPVAQAAPTTPVAAVSGTAASTTAVTVGRH